MAMLTAPPDPNRGDDILTWARSINGLLRALLPKIEAALLFQRRESPRTVTVPRHPFQVYITRTDFTASELKVKVQRGSVVEGEFFNGGIAISNLTDTFTLTPGDILWLQATFNLAGSITALQFLTGSAWTDFPALFTDSGASGNVWYHPIAILRAAETDEAPAFFGTLLLDQLTSTHLVTQRQCIDGTLIWKLVPGPGGII